LISVLYGLASALSWGGGDFVGGLASRKIGAYRAVLYAEAIGLLLLFGAAILWSEPMLSWQKILLAGTAGAIGSLGLLILYHAMTMGKMSIAMPVSALLAAVLPVIVGTVIEGLPTPIKFAGFACGLAGIWLVAQDTGEKTQWMRLADLRLPLFAGLCFGTYFIVMHQASDDALIWPMIASRTGGMLTLLVFVLARRESWRITPSVWPLISLNAVLDVGGNAFYILAGQTGRMDVAAVLGSLYPGATVILAWLVLKEKINTLQKLGILAALVAIVLMTLRSQP
jgi:drug/metabolite transporter (DMT)-like permease